MTGAWSDGIGGPLRASRSISAATTRSATGFVTSRWSIRMPEVLVEVAGPVVPPAEAAGAGLAEPVGVDEAPLEQAPERLPLRLRDVRPAVDGPRVPDVVVGRGDVEVAADEQRLRRVARSRPASGTAARTTAACPS